MTASEASKEEIEKTEKAEAETDEADKTKYAILNKVYYDVETGFGSIDNTYKQAKALDAAITSA